MSNEVYANGREISCKAAVGKSICAFPDVCLSPPSPPAGPVPIPYPNTGMASDTESGSKTVQISSQEVMLKDSSDFKQSTGDEAATKSQGMNVVTHQIQGKCYFTSWSMDVKIEGENAVRHLDMMTHNHASTPGGTPPWLYQDMVAADKGACEDQEKDAQKKCSGATPHMEPNSKGRLEQKGLDCTDDCRDAKACLLRPKRDDKSFCCHPETTGHHLVEVNNFTLEGGRQVRGLSTKNPIADVTVTYAVKASSERLAPFKKYDDEAAPCACASETVGANSHGVMHAVQSSIRDAYARARREDPLPADYDSYWTYGEARDAGARAHKIANPQCNEECTRRALDAYHKDQAEIDEDEPVRTDSDYHPSRKGLTGKQKGQIRQVVNWIIQNAD
jgi:hypothetical protein